ncbi:MAG: periplasmic heavy metal sensor [Rhodanobacteraceae bacterium]|nr:MAG: periplasmic heavy metal sensor [Rhodanobacteraceae bacterium]
MRKTRLVTSVLVAALACTPLAFAQTAGHAWHGHHGMAMGGHLYDKLGLSDAQRAQIKQITQQDFAQAKPQMQNLRQARQAYESATPGSADYQTAASNLAEAEADAARTRATNRAGLRAQIYQLLTPTQRTQLADIKAQRVARMQQWKQFQQQNPLPTSATQPAQ